MVPGPLRPQETALAILSLSGDLKLWSGAWGQGLGAAGQSCPGTPALEGSSPVGGDTRVLYTVENRDCLREPLRCPLSSFWVGGLPWKGGGLMCAAAGLGGAAVCARMKIRLCEWRPKQSGTSPTSTFCV